VLFFLCRPLNGKENKKRLCVLCASAVNLTSRISHCVLLQKKISLFLLLLCERVKLQPAEPVHKIMHERQLIKSIGMYIDNELGSQQNSNVPSGARLAHFVVVLHMSLYVLRVE